MQRNLKEPKYKFLNKKHEDAGIKHLNDPKAFIECSNTMDVVYNNIDDYNPARKRKVLIVFDNMIADIMSNKKFQTVVRKLFIRCRKINISLVFISQPYFPVPKKVRLNSTQYLIMKIHNKRELQNIASNYQSFILFDSMKIYGKCTSKPHYFFTIDTTLPAYTTIFF